MPDEVSDRDVEIDFALLTIAAELKGGTMAEIQCHPGTTDWMQDPVVDWETPWNASGGDFDDSVYFTGSYTINTEKKNPLSIDVTNIVRAWQKNLLPNYGILIKISVSDLEIQKARCKFDSGETSLKIMYSCSK